MSSRENPPGSIRRVSRATAVIGVALLVLLGGVTAGVVAGAGAGSLDGQAQVGTPADESDVDSLGAADELYLEEDGGGVLVYEDDDDDVDEFRLGADLSEGLAHALVVDDVEDESVEGEASAVLENDGLNATGAFQFDRPSQLEEFDLDVSGEQSAETAEFDAQLSALIGTNTGGPSAGTVAQTQAPFESVETNGEVVVGADSFTTNGDVTVDTAAPAGQPSSSEEELSVTLEGTGGGYELDVTQRGSVFNVGAWETEAQARQTIEAQYGALANELGGDASVELHDYSFEAQDQYNGWREVEFTVTYSGIDEGLETTLADQLAQDPSLDVDDDEAATIASQLTELEVDRVAFSYVAGAGSMEADWEVSLEEYAGTLEALYDLGEASVPDSEAASFEEQRAYFEDSLAAQEEAGLESTMEWSASAQSTQNEEVSVEAELSSDTSNYAAYVDALEERGHDVGEEVTFDLTATSDGDQVDVDGEFEIGMEDLAEDALSSAATSLREEGDDVENVADAIEESELEVARVDVDVSEGTTTVEAGAKFDGTETLLEDGAFGENVVVSHLASDHDTDNGEISIFAYVDDVEGDVDADQLRDLGLVDDDTTIHEPGEGDREFAEMDREAAAEYLDVTLGDDGGDGGDGMPGFGPVAALAAITAAAALLGRRR